MELENPIWNTFCYCNIFQISTYFELTQRFCFKFELPEICSLRLIVTTIANPPVLKLGQEVLHSGLQTLFSDLVDMHRLTLIIEEVMEFQKRLIVKLNRNFFSNLELCSVSYVCTLEIITSRS
jgi:hypothetical protein